MGCQTRTEFLSDWGFPPEWETWGLYPDALYLPQRETVAGEDAHFDEHLRYGAFCWWVRGHRELSEEILLKLCRLAALDSDPPMAGTAVREILIHPSATVAVADTVADLATKQAG